MASMRTKIDRYKETNQYTKYTISKTFESLLGWHPSAFNWPSASTFSCQWLSTLAWSPPVSQTQQPGSWDVLWSKKKWYTCRYMCSTCIYTYYIHTIRQVCINSLSTLVIFHILVLQQWTGEEVYYHTSGEINACIIVIFLTKNEKEM